MDTIVRNALLLGTNKSYAPKYVADTNGNLVETEVTKTADLDTSAKLTVDVVQRVVAKLRAQNAPTIGGDYVCIIHPYVAYDLIQQRHRTASESMGGICPQLHTFAPTGSA